ncbi:hypothetical protein D3C80_2104250 [compost metagenome]
MDLASTIAQPPANRVADKFIDDQSQWRGLRCGHNYLAQICRQHDIGAFQGANDIGCEIVCEISHIEVPHILIIQELSLDGT